jgi:hypothetical protein
VDLDDACAGGGSLHPLAQGVVGADEELRSAGREVQRIGGVGDDGALQQRGQRRHQVDGGVTSHGQHDEVGALHRVRRPRDGPVCDRRLPRTDHHVVPVPRVTAREGLPHLTAAQDRDAHPASRAPRPPPGKRAGATRSEVLDRPPRRGPP